MKEPLVQQKIGCVSCFKSLGTDSRMTIYKFLTEKHDTAVSEIVKFVELKQPTVSYHLNEMKKNGLLSSKKIGKEVFYTVNSVCPHYESACVAHGIKFLPAQN